ncbi:XRE family transcriptional regulator [Bradyrhizobium diazoefficiens]|nr:helix-turn-helix transcriptional regulator [Bradyrhizobium diazoefficiens]MBR0930652.1 XRE family transcriptional regulator [Bradyrhizobium diazoefficiens]
MTAEHDTHTVIDSSGNVFADLGLSTSDDDLLKVAIAGAITNIVKKRELSQSDAARIIGIDQPKMSLLLRGRLSGFSVDRMLKFLTLLGKDVDIRISAKSKNQPGRIKVIAA